jgi:protein SCO1/2
MMKTDMLILWMILFICLIGCTPVSITPLAESLSNTSVATQVTIVQSESVLIGEVLNPPILLQDFELPSSSGDAMKLSDLRGSWLVVFFGYLRCPDFCPLTLTEYKRVKKLLGDDAEAVKFVYISVDGVRDTPQAIRDYLDNFDAEFIGFSGDDTTLAQIQPDYGFYYQRRLEGGDQAYYAIDHSTDSYLIDPNGFLVSKFHYGTDPRDVTRAILAYLHPEGVSS